MSVSPSALAAIAEIEATGPHPYILDGRKKLEGAARLKDLDLSADYFDKTIGEGQKAAMQSDLHMAGSHLRPAGELGAELHWGSCSRGLCLKQDRVEVIG